MPKQASGKLLMDDLPVTPYHKIPAITFRTGTHPNGFPRLEAKAAKIHTLDPQQWQDKRCCAFRDERFCQLDAFMGAGKSVVQQMLALHHMRDGYRVIVACPRHDIVESFRAQRINVPGLGVVDWAPRVLDADSSDRKRELIRFLLLKGRSARDRAIVCTHQLLAQMLHEVEDSAWEGVSLFLDESQRILSNEAPELSNQIGRILHVVMGCNSSRATLSTATNYRNAGEILTTEQRKRFVAMPYHADEHLAGMNYLREIKLSLYCGPQEKVYRELLKQHKKTIVWLPLGQKAAVNQAQAAIYARLAPDSLNLVEKSSQHRNRKALMQGVRLEKEAHRELLVQHHREVQSLGRLPDAVKVPSHTPLTVVALCMLTDGADWPSCERGLLLGGRGSIGQLVQMLGRPLRDWPGKDQVEFVVVFDCDGGIINPNQVNDLFTVMIHHMIIGYQFQRAVKPLRKAMRPYGRNGEQLNSAKFLAGLVSEIFTEAVVAAGDPQELERATNKVVSRAVEEIGGDAEDETVVRRTLHDFFRTSGRHIAEDAESLLPLVDPKALQRDETGSELFRYFSLVFGYKTLKQLRKAIYGHKGGVPMSQEDLKAFIAHLYAKGLVWGPANENHLARWMKDKRILRERARFMASRG